MALRPICEPVELPTGTSVLAERVLIDRGTADVGNFMHFHDVAELVLFRRVSGSFISGDQTHPLDDGAVVFVPSMRHHDFALDGGAMEWVLIQFDPDVLGTLGVIARKLARSFCILPDEKVRARLDVLAEWLVEAAARRDPMLERITELLLLSLSEAQDHEPQTGAETSRIERLLPALELLRTAPGQAIALERAATSCRVSPAYFSRRFRQLFGMTFTDYARSYRLRLAARRLVSGGAPISEVAYGVGFSSPAHFTARFRERFGMTPREYRANARQRAAG